MSWKKSQLKDNSRAGNDLKCGLDMDEFRNFRSFFIKKI